MIIPQLTVLQVIDQIMPGWTLRKWFGWPPDLFLMTSYLLQKTGAYRALVNSKEWTFHDYGHQKKLAREWQKSLQVTLQNGEKDINYPSEILNKIIQLDNLSQRVNFSNLKVLATSDADARNLSALIIELHVLADVASAGIGILGSGDLDNAILHYLANLLLVTRGTLSTVPKHQGIVVPKFRTPQSGLTLRSFSHHLTYHTTEVEIVWRSIPWVNVDQNTLNILCVPWPDEVKCAQFKVEKETFESVRYFTYENNGNIHNLIHGLVAQINDLNKEKGRVHMIVFPEMALSEAEYNYLLDFLKFKFENNTLAHIPLVLAGVRSSASDPFGKTDPSDLKSFQRNEVKLAAYFVGKWYDLSQTKHHRWKLDRNQLRQYELSSKLTTERNWFEHIAIYQRRISFFAPNSWLALSPLICEDLAQLEPVSEIIRGVGPTLLIALLMDGPQIKERWPARYASIFADDPGTAVLTMTSRGMLLKSRPLEENRNGIPEKNDKPESVALWKDQLKGWENIWNRESNSTALLTISASFREEVTADGRTDSGAASVFKLDNVYYPGKIIDQKEELPDEAKEEFIKKTAVSIWRGHYHDLRELSCATFAVDALISSYGKNWGVIQDLIIPKEKYPGDEYEMVAETGKGNYYVRPDEYYAHPKAVLFQSYIDPTIAGIADDQPTGQETEKDVWPTQSLFWGLEEISRWWETFEKARLHIGDKEESEIKLKEQFRFFAILIDEAEKELHKMGIENSKIPRNEDNELDKARIKKAIVLAILAGIHNRLDAYRRRYQRILSLEIREKFTMIEELLAVHNSFP